MSDPVKKSRPMLQTPKGRRLLIEQLRAESERLLPTQRASLGYLIADAANDLEWLAAAYAKLLAATEEG